MKSLRKARRTLRKAQAALDLSVANQGDLWAALDSMVTTVELWMKAKR